MTTPQDPNQPQGWGGQQPGPGQQPPQGQPQGQQPAPGQPGQPWAGGQQQPPPGQPGQPWDGGQQQPPPGQPGQPWAGANAQGSAEPKKADWKKRLPLVLVALVAALVFALFRNGVFASDPEAGDCTTGSLSSVEIVDCDDSDATYEIAGVLEDVTGTELGGVDSPCLDQWPDSTAYAVDADSQTEQGTGYCLQPIG